MELNQEKVEEPVLAVLWLTLHDQAQGLEDDRLGHHGSIALEGIHF